MGVRGRVLDMRDVLLSQMVKVSALLELIFWRRKQKIKHTSKSNQLLINTLQRIKTKVGHKAE